MIAAVFDTNILASGTVSAAGPTGQVIDAWRAGQCDLIISEPIFAELTLCMITQTFDEGASYDTGT